MGRNKAARVVVAVICAGIVLVGGSWATAVGDASAAGQPAADVWSAVSAAGHSADHPGHACGIQTDGSLWCWGPNSAGQLGVGDKANRSRPARVGADSDWVAVSASWNGTCGVRAAGTLWCWGKPYGAVPEQVGSGTSWTAVSVGDRFRCGIQTDASLWCWGANADGQLGLGDTASRTSPTRVGDDLDWRTVASGRTHTCAVRVTGTLWCWGTGTSGELGLGDRQTALIPTRVGSASVWVQVAVGLDASCATREHHSGWCWGDNASGQLGTADGLDHNVPTKVVSAETWTQIVVGSEHACGLRSDGTLWCWGENESGQLGIGSTQDYEFPVQVGSAMTWTQAAGGAEDACAVRSDLTLWCWGNPERGELGVGNRTERTSVPTQVGLPNEPTVVVATLKAVSALSANDVWAVGYLQRDDTQHTLVKHWDGTSWVRVPSVDPGGRINRLSGVAAIAPDDVWAVGAVGVKGVAQPLIEHWNGVEWSQVPSPQGNPRTSELTAVVAVSTTDIWAVGYKDLEFGDAEVILQHWDGATWSLVPDVEPGWLHRELTGVTALSGDNVWAVGFGYEDEEAGNVAFSLHWDGTSWQQVPIKVADHFEDYPLLAVEAVNPRDIWGVGSQPGTDPLVEHWTGQRWRAVGAHTDNDAVLRGVSSARASDVWAVGSTGSPPRSLAIHWDGTDWAQVEIPTRGGTSALSGVSVLTTDDAWAVGTSGSGRIRPTLIEHWDGTSWTIVD